MKQYHELLAHVLDHGTFKGDRTGTGTRSVFGWQMRFDLTQGFPLITTKKLHIRSIVHELLWLISGNTNVAYLQANGVTIWDEWALKDDEFEEYTLDKTQRAKIYAELAGMSMHAVAQQLQIKDREAEAASNRGEFADDGHVFLDKQGVPRTGRRVLRERGDLGPVYGKQWRRWESPHPVERAYTFEQRLKLWGEQRIHPNPHDVLPHQLGDYPEARAASEKLFDAAGIPRTYTTTEIDQLADIIAELKRNPTSRRLIVSAWNVADLPEMALQPCHSFFQFYATELSPEERYQLFWEAQAQTAGVAPSDRLMAVADEMANVKQQIHDATSPEKLRAVIDDALTERQIPKYRLACQIYIRKQYCGLAA